MSKGIYTKCDYGGGGGDGCRTLADAVCAFCGNDYCGDHSATLAVHANGSLRDMLDDNNNNPIFGSALRICNNCVSQWHTEASKPSARMAAELFEPIVETMKAMIVEGRLSEGRPRGTTDHELNPGLDTDDWGSDDDGIQEPKVDEPAAEELEAIKDKLYAAKYLARKDEDS
jgi:hypothetical protein